MASTSWAGPSAVVEDGKIVNTSASSISDSSKKKAENSGLDKEAFLQLLVAQMQYQDPLEPMDNTEYVSQLATFSELEAMNNLNDSMGFARAAQLVGKNVIMKTTSATTGEMYMTQGVVDYVVYENGIAYLSIKDSLFALDDLDTVISDEYWEKYGSNLGNDDIDQDVVTQIVDIIKMLAALPDDKAVTLDDADNIKAARSAYDKLAEEDKPLVPNEAVYKLIKAEAALARLNAGSGKGDSTSGSGE